MRSTLLIVLKLAQKLSNEVQAQGKAPEMFIQINTGEEEQKSGISPSEADQFISDCLSLDLPIKGLMVIPPINEEPSLTFWITEKNCSAEMVLQDYPWE